MDLSKRKMIFYFAVLLLFVGANGKVYFKEEFDDDKWESSWTSSEHAGMEWGKFILTTGKYFGDPNISKGIQTSQDAMFYGLSTKIEPFSNKGKVFVLQFSVKHEQNVECGGGYIKVFDCNLSQKDLHAQMPYLIMFGPDICGFEKKIHVIFNYKGKNLSIKKHIPCKDDVFTHFYTLVVKPDNTYVVKVDNVVVTKGKLENDWEFLPSSKIKHYDVKKPADYSKDVIEDSDDEKQVDGNLSEDIVDPDSSKIVEGDPLLYAYDEICGIGFDLWQVKSGTIFDNILITDDELEAEKYADTWGAIRVKEKKMRKEQEKEGKFTDDNDDVSDEEDRGFDEDYYDDEEDDSEEEQAYGTDRTAIDYTDSPEIYIHHEL